MAKQKKQPLYNFSEYATTYHTDDGSVRGVMLSGYLVDNEDNKHYINLWLNGQKATFKTAKDGSPVLCIKMREISRSGADRPAKARGKGEGDKPKTENDENVDDYF